ALDRSITDSGFTRYRFAMSQSFRCADCGKTKRADIIAYPNGKSTDPICYRCWARRHEAAKKPPATGSEPLRNVAPIRDFLSQAGIRVTASQDGWLVVEGRRALELSRTQGRAVDWPSLIDQVVYVHAADHLIDALQSNAALLGDGLRAFPDRDLHGFVLRRD